MNGPTSTSSLPQVLTSFNELIVGEASYWGETKIGGRPAYQFGTMISDLIQPAEPDDFNRYAANVELSWTFDAETGAPLYFNNAGEDGYVLRPLRRLPNLPPFSSVAAITAAAAATTNAAPRSARPIPQDLRF